MTLLPKRYSQIGMFLLMKLSIPIPHRLMSQLVLLFLTPLLSLFNLLFLCCFLNLGLLSPQLFLLHLSHCPHLFILHLYLFFQTLVHLLFYLVFHLYLQLNIPLLLFLHLLLHTQSLFMHLNPLFLTYILRSLEHKQVCTNHNLNCSQLLSLTMFFCLSHLVIRMLKPYQNGRKQRGKCMRHYLRTTLGLLLLFHLRRKHLVQNEFTR